MTRKPTNTRICVLGAGAAGLSAAYYLQQSGYTDVTVLEQAGRIGGKCCSITHRGRSFDLGANYVTPAYTEIRRLARKLGASLYTETTTITATIPPGGPASFTKPLIAITRGKSFLGFAWALLRYFWIRFWLRSVIDPPGFAQFSRRADLCVSFRAWLANNGLSALETMFEVPITIMGYGYLDEVPAPCALKYMSLKTCLNLVMVGLGLPTRWPKRFVDGFERFWDRIAWSLDVRLNMNVVRIERQTPIRVSLSTGQVMEFDELILACPLTAATLGLFLTLSVEERDLFTRILVNPYVVTTYAIPNLKLPQRIVGMLPVPAMGRPWAITQQFTGNDLVQFYVRVDPAHTITQSRVLDAVREDVIALGAMLPAAYVTYDEWGYFPHVTPAEFRTGFYDRFEALQGKNHTYFCGGIAAFELVEPIVEYSRQLVNTHF